MSFTTREESLQDGRPVYFFQFFRTGKNWYYTNTDREITFNSVPYEPMPVSVSSMRRTGDAKSDELRVTMPASAGISQYIDNLSPSDPLYLRIRKGHMTETASTGAFSAPVLADAPVCWVGEVLGTQRPTPNQRVFVCNSIGATMSRGGLRLTWSRQCPHMLYSSRGCKVNKADFDVALSSVTVVNGITISSTSLDALPDGWFTGGFIEWLSEAGVTERRGIETHLGAQAVLFGTTQGISTGTSFVAYPGCSRLPAICDSKFDNSLNFGGIEHLQGKSPFDGTPIF